MRRVEEKENMHDEKRKSKSYDSGDVEPMRNTLLDFYGTRKMKLAQELRRNKETGVWEMVWCMNVSFIGVCYHLHFERKERMR